MMWREIEKSISRLVLNTRNDGLGQKFIVNGYAIWVVVVNDYPQI